VDDDETNRTTVTPAMARYFFLFPSLLAADHTFSLLSRILSRRRVPKDKGAAMQLTGQRLQRLMNGDDVVMTTAKRGHDNGDDGA